MIVASGLALSAATVQAQTVVTPLFPGITHIKRTEQYPPFQCPGCPAPTPSPRLARINILLIDLTSRRPFQADASHLQRQTIQLRRAKSTGIWDLSWCNFRSATSMESVSFLSAVAPCEYLPDRLWQLRYELVPNLRPADYVQRMQQGWRRFGYAMFRPECPSCRMCQSLRVPVATFRPNQSQRRAWKRNHGEVTVRVGAPSLSPDRLDLWARFHRHGHETKGWPAEGEGDPGLLLENPFRTEEWTYYVGDRLIAVGYVDALPEALSAIYCYYDPAERARSLGTFNVLSLLAAARERALPHVYLGYYVAGCRSTEYKRRFRPNEVLRVDGTWEAFNAG